jgi:hypothetical protein
MPKKSAQPIEEKKEEQVEVTSKEETKPDKKSKTKATKEQPEVQQEEVKPEKKTKGKATKEEQPEEKPTKKSKEVSTPPPTKAVDCPSAPIKMNDKQDIEKAYESTKEEWAKAIMEEHKLNQEKERIDGVKKNLLKILDDLQKKCQNSDQSNMIEKLAAGSVKNPVKKEIINHIKVDTDSSDDSDSDSDSSDEPVSILPKKSQPKGKSAGKTLKLSKPSSDSDDDDEEFNDAHKEEQEDVRKNKICAYMVSK